MMASAIASLNSREMSADSSAKGVSRAMTFADCIAAIADKAVAWSVSRYNHLYNSCCTHVGTISVSGAVK